MKLQLDTDKKIIKIDENVKLTKLFSLVKKLLPNGEWQDFTLETNTVIEHWHNPIIYRDYYPVAKPWWEQPWVSMMHECNATTMKGVSGASGSNLIDTCENASKGVQNNTIKTAYELKTGVFNVEVE
jgi:hypothetical protein